MKFFLNVYFAPVLNFFSAFLCRLLTEQFHEAFLRLSLLKFPHHILHIFHDIFESRFQEVFDVFLDLTPFRRGGSLWEVREVLLQGLLVPSLQVWRQLPEFPGHVSVVYCAIDWAATSGQGFDSGLDVLRHVADEIPERAILYYLNICQSRQFDDQALQMAVSWKVVRRDLVSHLDSPALRVLSEPIQHSFHWKIW